MIKHVAVEKIGGKMKVIIIGGVAAGMSAAAKLKREKREAEIVVYEKGDYVSYGACGLPYYISNVNDDYRKMLIRSVEEFENSGINCKLHHEVLAVNPAEKKVQVKDLKTGTVFLDSYDKLMVASGARSASPPFPGIELEGVMSLRTMNDGHLMKEKAMDKGVKNVIIVGAGFIGIELAEAFRELDKNVTVIEMQDHILNNFEPEIESIAIKELIDNKINLRLGEGLVELKGEGHVNQVVTTKGVYDADMVVLALGIKPNTEMLKDTGVNLAKNGAVIVDREMRTSVEDIYAAGDCAEVYHYVMQQNTFIPLGTNANKCGRIAGSNLAGKHIEYQGTLGSTAIKIFNVEMAKTGISQNEALSIGIESGSSFIETFDHIQYYPGQSPLWIKVIYEKETKRILGAQAVGNKGAVLRIDVFAAAIQGNMTTEQLGMTDFCYAPPFAGVWDAVNIACNAAR